MSRSAQSYQREIAKLYAMLETVEWVQPTYNGSPSCSYCGNMKHWAHEADCLLAKLLDARLKRTPLEAHP